MGLNYRKKIAVSESIFMKCNSCNTLYEPEYDFCPVCGCKLISEKTTLYANIGKNGITSFSCKLPNGCTYNSKRGTITIPISKGLSSTYRIKN